LINKTQGRNHPTEQKKNEEPRAIFKNKCCEPKRYSYGIGKEKIYRSSSRMIIVKNRTNKDNKWRRKKEKADISYAETVLQKKGDGLPSYSLSLSLRLSILHHRPFFPSPSLITINERYQSPIKSSLLHEKNT
jgi:hypothetical protein